MTVCSPYAVFRAADVCWPLVLQPAWPVNPSPLAAAPVVRAVAPGRPAQQAPAPWRTMVQGELFQHC